MKQKQSSKTQVPVTDYVCATGKNNDTSLIDHNLEKYLNIYFKKCTICIGPSLLGDNTFILGNELFCSYEFSHKYDKWKTVFEKEYPLLKALS